MFSFFTGSTQGNINLSKSHPEQLRVGGKKQLDLVRICVKKCAQWNDISIACQPQL